MKPSVLMIGPLMDHVQQEFDRHYVVHRLWQVGDKEQLLNEQAALIRAIGTDGHLGASRMLMQHLPNLEVIVSQGVGYDSIDVAYAKEHGIGVSNTPDVLNDAVADMALGLMLALCRRIPQCDRFVRDGRWLKGGFPLTAELTGARVGILGLGRIGKEIARRCEAFKMQVAYHGRSRQAGQNYTYFGDLVEMARNVDWLVAIAPGDTGTEGIVSRQVLEALGPNGCFVNVSRGSLVDEPAMVELLQSGALGGAALDVFADEPRVPQALMPLENVVLVPHVGSATVKTRRAMGDLVIANLAAHFAGKPLLTPVA